jgi:hypothetical protein
VRESVSLIRRWGLQGCRRPGSGTYTPTRPYLYDVGQGVLMLSVGQGPGAAFEPYGVLRSSRWNVKDQAGTSIGMSYQFGSKAETFTSFEDPIHLPVDTGLSAVFDRDIFDHGNHEAMAVVYATIKTGVGACYLMISADSGATWNPFPPSERVWSRPWSVSQPVK